MSYAGFWKRFVAYLIDGILLSVVFVGLTFAFGISIFEMDPNNPTAALGAGLAINLVSIIGVWLYFAYFESSHRQATPGKMAMGIKVTDINGSAISFGRATGRFFGKYLSGLILMIGYIMAGFTERKQGLHDIIAGTLVVNQSNVMV